MNWNDLSMADRANYIRLGVKSGITDIGSIKEIYNKYVEGGYKPRAYARRAGEIPTEYRDPEIDYEKHKNQAIYVDEAGKPISGDATKTHDVSNVSWWRPSLKSTGQIQLDKVDAEEIRRKRVDRHIQKAGYNPADIILGATSVASYIKNAVLGISDYTGITSILNEDSNKTTIYPLNNVVRVTKNSGGLNSILFNDFVESSGNNIRKAKEFKNTTDTLIGDRNIPLSRISQFYGVEDGKVRTGSLDIFDPETVVVPRRNPGKDKVKKVIRGARHGFPIPNTLSFITENNDTVPIGSPYQHKIPIKNKFIFSNEQGNSIFINNISDITDQQLKELNGILESSPGYPVLVDNGRYKSFLTNLEGTNPLLRYTEIDLPRPDDRYYIIGTK